MDVILSEAEQQRRRLFKELTERGFLPEPLLHRELYSHSGNSKLLFVDFTEDERVSKRIARERFVHLRPAADTKRGPTG